MKEKIMNIKNILKILISVFIIFNMIKSCSHATVNRTELNENLTKIKDAGLITGLPNLNVNEINSELNRKNYYVILITNGNTGQSSYNNKLYVMCPENNSYVNSQYGEWRCRGNKYSLAGSNESTGSFIDFTTNMIKYCYTTCNINAGGFVLGAGEEYGYQIMGVKLDFTPNSNISNLTVNNRTGVNGIYSRKLEDPIWRYDK